MSSVRVAESALHALVHDCFVGAGLPGEDATAIADVLVDANLRGVESHGVARVPAYLRRVREGLAGGTDRMTVAAATGAVRRLDAGHALGPAAGVKAIDLAGALAGEHGIGLVALGRGTHFGPAGFYARRAARAGLFALVTSNGPANMAPHGAREAFLGTNALALGAPLGRHGEFVLDMSSSIVARGRIIRAAALGQAIEPGLAIDAAGAATTDAAAALAGAVLPVGGAKGSGLALGISLLAGVLGGGDFDDELAPMHGDSGRAQNVGQLFVAIDPAALGSPEAGLARAEAMIDRLHALAPAPGFDAVRHAGERGERTVRERRAAGIPVERAELDAVASACRESGLAAIAQRAEALSAS